MKFLALSKDCFLLHSKNLYDFFKKSFFSGLMYMSCMWVSSMLVVFPGFTMVFLDMPVQGRLLSASEVTMLAFDRLFSTMDSHVNDKIIVSVELLSAALPWTLKLATVQVGRVAVGDEGFVVLHHFPTHFAAQTLSVVCVSNVGIKSVFTFQTLTTNFTGEGCSCCMFGPDVVSKVALGGEGGLTLVTEMVPRRLGAPVNLVIME